MNVLLISLGLPLFMWGEAIKTACHIQNKVSHKKTGKIPYGLWKGCPPNLKYLTVWGCMAKVGLPEPKKKKLGSKTSDCVFIGYVECSVAYRFLVLRYEVLELNTNIEVNNAEFFEDVFPMKDKLPNNSQDKNKGNATQEHDSKSEHELGEVNK